jgi:hypothetical protein
VLSKFSHPEPLFVKIHHDTKTMTSIDKFVFIKASPLKDTAAESNDMRLETATAKKKKKPGGGRMAKDAGTKGMKLKMRKRC